MSDDFMKKEEHRFSGGLEESGTSLRVEAVFTSDVSYLKFMSALAREFCQTCLEPLGLFDEHIFFNVELVLTEACVNAIKHAYGEQRGPVEVEFFWNDPTLSFHIADYGKSFTEFDKYIRRDISEVDPLSTSGRGLIIMRTLMDEVTYTCDLKTGRNTLKMSKTMESPPPSEAGQDSDV